jgi:hypothetical protein
MANRDDLDVGMNRNVPGARDWSSEESYWRENYASRPYASSDRGFDYFRPGYRYGFESASRLRGRDWNEVEPELRGGWERFEHRGQSTWEHVKDAVKDAWRRATGADREPGADRDATRPTY